MKEKIKYMAKSKKATASEVAETENSGVVTEVRTTDKNGNQFLPGHEQTVKVIPELRDKVKHVKEVLTPPFQAAHRALSVGKQELLELIEQYKPQFGRDEEKGVLFYDDGEVSVTIQEKDSVSYEVKKEE